MSKTIEKIILVATDFLTINLAFYLLCRLRMPVEFFSEQSFWGHFQISFFIFIFWFLLFVFFGLYRIPYTQSRIDELISATKVISIGVFIIFLITFDFDFDHPITLSRVIIVTYWGMLILLVGFGRILLRTIHRKFLEAGIGLRRTVIIGWNEKSQDLYDKVVKAPALGYQIVGFLSIDSYESGQHYKEIPVLGKLDELYYLIHKEKIQEVIIALSHRMEKQIETAISFCNGTSVGIKIVPELYDAVIGQVRTNQIYGFPLIEILPLMMPFWERIVKRMLDIVFSLFILVCFLPLWVLIALVILIDSKGPVFYSQKRVGKDGKIFNMLKFRSMVDGAEKMTGPVWATDKDKRITRTGRILRKLRFDEVPQFINILDGDMSLVGPRPERPFFVEKLKKELPLYTRRLRVRPGITGWAQVKGEYDQSIEHVKRKLKYDIYYLENMSLRMDLKILVNTVYVMVTGKGH